MALYSTADLCDRFGPEAQVCHAPLRSYGGRPAASGRIACVRGVEDAGLLRQALSRPGEGRVLVFDGGGSLQVAVLGDNMARIGRDQAWAGVVVHGAVRDVEQLAAMDFAVLALGSVPARGGNQGLGETGGTVAFGGAVFTPGHFACFDRDGLVVLAAAPAPGAHGSSG